MKWLLRSGFTAGLIIKLAMSSSSAVASAPDSIAFQDGAAARLEWETWFSHQHGRLRDGASFWAGERSLVKVVPCDEADANPEFRAGCSQARAKLALSDLRRKTELDFKSGWNSVDEKPEDNSGDDASRSASTSRGTSGVDSAAVPSQTPDQPSNLGSKQVFQVDQGKVEKLKSLIFDDEETFRTGGQSLFTYATVAQPVVRVTAQELAHLYTDNEVHADGLFNAKEVEVTGVIN